MLQNGAGLTSRLKTLDNWCNKLSLSAAADNENENMMDVSQIKQEIKVEIKEEPEDVEEESEMVEEMDVELQEEMREAMKQEMEGGVYQDALPEYGKLKLLIYPLAR